MTMALASCGWWPRYVSGALAMLLMLAAVTSRARAAEPEPPSKEFLEYLGTLEAEGEDWTIFESSRAPVEQPESPRPPTKEKLPTPPAGDEP